MSTELTVDTKDQFLASSGFVLMVDFYYGNSICYGLFHTESEANEWLKKLKLVSTAKLIKVIQPQFNQG